MNVALIVPTAGTSASRVSEASRQASRACRTRSFQSRRLAHLPRRVKPRSQGTSPPPVGAKGRSSSRPSDFSVVLRVACSVPFRFHSVLLRCPYATAHTLQRPASSLTLSHWFLSCFASDQDHATHTRRLVQPCGPRARVDGRPRASLASPSPLTAQNSCL